MDSRISEDSAYVESSSSGSTARRYQRRARGCGPRSRWPKNSTSIAPDATDAQVLDAMVAHPILIERPIVETAKGVRLCRPQDLVRESIL